MRKKSSKSKVFGVFLILVALFSWFQNFQEIPSAYGWLFLIIGLLLQGDFSEERCPMVLHPWEIKALEDAKERNFATFSELYFSYRFLEDPRSKVLGNEFKSLLQADKELLKAFRAYCTWHRTGGLAGELHFPKEN